VLPIPVTNCCIPPMPKLWIQSNVADGRTPMLMLFISEAEQNIVEPFPVVGSWMTSRFSTINVCKTCFVVWLIHQIVSLCGWHRILISKLKGRLSQPACLVAFSIPDLMCESAAQTVFPRTQMGLCIFWKHQHEGRGDLSMSDASAMLEHCPA